MSRRIKTIDVKCPMCFARPGQRCRSMRIPSANTLGGGWGGPAELTRSHKLRVEARKIEEQKANLRSFLAGHDADTGPSRLLTGSDWDDYLFPTGGTVSKVQDQIKKAKQTGVYVYWIGLHRKGVRSQGVQECEGWPAAIDLCGSDSDEGFRPGSILGKEDFTGDIEGCAS